MGRPGPVEVATRADLRRLGVSVQRSGLAAGAVRLARLLDAAETSASGAAAAMRELRTVLGELATTRAPTQPLTAAAADEPKGDNVDDLADRRAARRGSAG